MMQFSQFLYVFGALALAVAAPATEPNANYFPLHRIGYSGLQRRSNGIGSLTELDLGDYYTPVKIGSQIFNLVVDTGSSDTWVPAQDVQCQDPFQNDTPLSQCGFGTLFTPGPEFTKINNELFNTVYGSGDAISGYFGMVNTTVAGITSAAFTFDENLTNKPQCEYTNRRRGTCWVAWDCNHRWLHWSGFPCYVSTSGNIFSFYTILNYYTAPPPSKAHLWTTRLYLISLISTSMGHLAQLI
jgi:hypothetical protein